MDHRDPRRSLDQGSDVSNGQDRWPLQTERTAAMAIDTNELLETTDGLKWAEEFMRMFGDSRDEITIDLMAGWFANAVETGRRAGEKDQLAPAVAASENVGRLRAALQPFATFDGDKSQAVADCFGPGEFVVAKCAYDATQP